MSKYKEIKAALLGAGTVGGGVYKLVERRAAEMQAKVGADLKITKVMVKNLQKKREAVSEESALATMQQSSNRNPNTLRRKKNETS